MRSCASPYASANQLIATAGIRKSDAHGPNNAGTQYTPLKEQFVLCSFLKTGPYWFKIYLKLSSGRKTEPCFKWCENMKRAVFGPLVFDKGIQR